MPCGQLNCEEILIERVLPSIFFDVAILYSAVVLQRHRMKHNFFVLCSNNKYEMKQQRREKPDDYKFLRIELSTASKCFQVFDLLFNENQQCGGSHL